MIYRIYCFYNYKYKNSEFTIIYKIHNCNLQFSKGCKLQKSNYHIVDFQKSMRIFYIISYT